MEDVKRLSRVGVCGFEGCGRAIRARRLCVGHYEQHRKGQQLRDLRGTALSEDERFWAYTDKRGPDDCWEWTAGRSQGYGVFNGGGRSYGAHVKAYEMVHGSVPKGLVLDHKCRNRACVNVAHLQVVNVQENAQNRSAYVSSKTGIRGVSPTASGKFAVHVSKGKGKNVFGGLYSTIEEAERAAVALRNKMFTNNVWDREAKFVRE